MKMKPVRVLIFLAALAMASCGLEEFNYVMSQAPGQLLLLMNRHKISTVLKSKDLDPEVRRKLLLVLDVKKYAEDRVGLVRNNSYAVYRPLERETVTYNLTACPRLSLEPLSWDFPVVGKLPYLGFFKKQDADKKRDELLKKGNDVYVRKADAYSMLGIVADPLYTPMLKDRDYDLANTVVHELAHGTIWAKGYPEFNENLALFIGNQGAENFCREKYGPDAEEVKYGIGSNQDDIVFQKYLTHFSGQIKELYARKDLSDDQKLDLKKDLFARTKIDFRDNWLPQMKTGYYRGWLDRELNNATVASRLVYYHDISLYQKVYEKNGSDMIKTIDLIKSVVDQESGNPEDNLRNWLSAN